MRRTASVMFLAAYAAAVGAVTLLPISPRPAEGPWWAAIHWLPFDVDAPSFVLNVVLFVPFGVLVPLVRPAADAYRRVGGAAFLTSGGIELAQLVLDLLPGGRRTVDVNDLLANTAGAVAGLLVLRLAVPAAAHRMALCRPAGGAGLSRPAAGAGLSRAAAGARLSRAAAGAGLSRSSAGRR